VSWWIPTGNRSNTTIKASPTFSDQKQTRRSLPFQRSGAMFHRLQKSIAAIARLP